MLRSLSALSVQILKRIWDIADWQKRGLAWEEFVVTLKLISAAQKKPEPRRLHFKAEIWP